MYRNAKRDRSAVCILQTASISISLDMLAPEQSQQIYPLLLSLRHCEHATVRTLNSDLPHTSLTFVFSNDVQHVGI